MDSTKTKKAILSFNEELMDNCIAERIDPNANVIESFYQCMVERTMELLGLPREEAENLINGNDESVSYEVDLLAGKIKGYIRFSEYTEYLQVVDLPAEDKEEKLEVATTAGTLKAFKTSAPGVPGICVMLQPAGSSEEIDLSFAYVCEDNEQKAWDDEERDVDVVVLTYGDPTDEDYTRKDIIRREDVLRGVFGPDENRLRMKALKAVLLLRKLGNRYLTKEEQLAETLQWYCKENDNEGDLDSWIFSLQRELAKSPEQREEESRLFCEELAEREADQLYREMYEEREYTSCTAGDYGPSNPWDAPGMSISDFI